MGSVRGVVGRGLFPGPNGKLWGDAGRSLGGGSAYKRCESKLCKPWVGASY